MSSVKIELPRKKAKKRAPEKTAIWITLPTHSWLMELSSLTGLPVSAIVDKLVEFSTPYLEIVGDPVRFKMPTAKQEDVVDADGQHQT